MNQLNLPVTLMNKQKHQTQTMPYTRFFRHAQLVSLKSIATGYA